jgi:hypothetical protein
MDKPQTTPQEYFAALAATAKVARRSHAVQAYKVDRTKKSWLHEQFEVFNDDGVKLVITPQLLALFYDLTVPQVMGILRISRSVMRKVRVWCNLSRWPRVTLLEGNHPILTASAVRNERLHILRWAWEQQELVLYSMLHRAHKMAGYPVHAIPAPLPVPAAETAQLPPLSSEPGPAAEPQPTQASDPQPTQASGPQPTQASAPQPTQASAPQPTQASGPQPTQASGPQPTQALEREVTEDDIDWDGLFGGDGQVPLTDIDNDEWKAFVQHLEDGRD